MPKATKKNFSVVDSTTKPEPTLSDRLTHTLREAIVSGELAAGSKLSEPKLAEQYQTSRGPIREAIRRMEMMQLVHHVPHEGVRVVSLDLANMVELYHVREALEGKAAALAATNMTAEAIDQLGELLNLHQQHQERTGEYMQATGDFDFHYRVIKGSNNAMLVRQLTEELYYLIRMYRQQFSLMRSRSEVALREHEQIFRAIESRDEALAEMVMRRHIVRARKEIENQLRNA
ncbi:MAG: GntR family transcriptional regulator [Arenicella sp.]